VNKNVSWIELTGYIGTFRSISVQETEVLRRNPQICHKWLANVINILELKKQTQVIKCQT